MWKETPIFQFYDRTGIYVLVEDDFFPLSTLGSVHDDYPRDWWRIENGMDQTGLEYYCILDSCFRRWLEEARSSESVHRRVLIEGHTTMVDRCLKIFMKGYPAGAVEPVWVLLEPTFSVIQYVFSQRIFLCTTALEKTPLSSPAWESMDIKFPQ